MTMQQEALIVGAQVLMFLLFILVGIFCVKLKMFTYETGKALSSFVFSVITPCLVINSYQVEYNPDMMQRIWLSIGLAVAFHIVSTSVAFAFIRSRPGYRHRIERVGVIFSNCGYMAVPLIQATVGAEGVIYSAGFIAIFSVLLWSLGAIVLQGDKRPPLVKILITPASVGFVVGLMLYRFGIILPGAMGDAVRHISGMNTPLAMIVIGVFLSKLDFKDTFTDKYIYRAAFLKLIAVPVLLVLLFKAANVAQWMDRAEKVVMACMLAAACPSAASTTLFPVKLGMDGEYGAKIIAVSTLLAVITLPAMSYLTNLLLM